MIRSGDFRYSFLHDRVQEAAKSAIPEETKIQMHLEIGLFLLDKINLERKVIVFNSIEAVHVHNSDTKVSKLDRRRRKTSWIIIYLMWSTTSTGHLPSFMTILTK